MKTRQKYSAEFKREAVELTRQPGTSCRQIALDLGIAPNLLSRWKRELDGRSASASATAFSGSGTARDQEIAALKRELSKVKKERDFLRDAAAFFARESS